MKKLLEREINNVMCDLGWTQRSSTDGLLYLSKTHLQNSILKSEKLRYYEFQANKHYLTAQ